MNKQYVQEADLMNIMAYPGAKSYEAFDPYAVFEERI